jgi:hypothetical protein
MRHPIARITIALAACAVLGLAHSSSAQDQ